MAARILTLACVVHQASSFAAPLSRPAGVVVDELLAPFRADCGLYEAYVRPDGLPQLHCRLAVLRGADDGVTTRSEMLGWLDEFDTNEVKIISVARATHHAYEE